MKIPKLFFGLILMINFFAVSRELSARQGFSVGLGPVGNVFLIDTIPIMDPGVGGHMFFNYRFHEQTSFEVTFLLSAQDGTNVSSADSGILFLGMPTFDIKLYFLKDDPHWDPFVSTGIGVYYLTEGRVDNATGGIGLGSQLGVGFDYYLTEQISTGFSGVFRSIGVITNVGTPSASTAIFPYSLTGNIAFHF